VIRSLRPDLCDEFWDKAAVLTAGPEGQDCT
jgi:hypothetical protein